MSRYEWNTTHPSIDRLQAAVMPARRTVVQHPLYDMLDSRESITTFMEHHVFAVWDFMSLLKSLQRNLTCVEVPWVPTGPTASRRLINDIVLVEESDQLGGGFTSHFELYIAGMTQAGADTAVIARFIEEIRSGNTVPTAVVAAQVPQPSAQFMTQTWGFINSGSVHCQAAAFAFGREDLIPDMFSRIVTINQEVGGFDTFIDYLERHIEVDGEEHTPMAMQMLADLCGDDEQKWRECTNAVTQALNARTELWDGIAQSIDAARRPTVSLGS